MPEIKVKHVVSFSSEDKVHKAENLLKAETYRKWKCATPGEKNATVVLQFEKATKIHSIDIGNEGSAFVEVLVGRSSDSVSDYQVLLVASSFMSPLESRNGTHTNRVRMFGPEKLSQNTKDEKWDCVQVICTQPFNKNLQYGLTFIKFHSPPEKVEEQSNSTVDGKTITKLGAFKLRMDDDEDSLPSIDSVFKKQRAKASENSSGHTDDQDSPSYAEAVLAANSNASKVTSQDNSLKRKVEENSSSSQEPPAKKTSLDKEHIVYKDVLRGTPESKKKPDTNKNLCKEAPSPKVREKKKEPSSPSSMRKQVAANNTPTKPSRQKVPFNKIMDRVVFVLSGFVNPLRSELRQKALEMGAKYRPDWDASCTHLVCAFAKTPKYEQVKKVNGRIVTKEWILDCYTKKEPILWRKYDMSGVDSSDEQDDSDKDPDFNNKASAADDVDDSDEDQDYGDEEDDEESDEFIVEDSDEDTKKKKKKKPQKRFQRSKIRAANSPNKKKPQSPVGKNQTVKNNVPSTGVKSNISDSEDEGSSPKKETNSSIFNKILKNSHKKDISDNSQSPTLLKAEDESETEDEEALQDYVADTDVEDDSGGDTEDEIRKIEARTRKKNVKMNGTNEDMEITEIPDVSELPLPDLPDFFKKRHFFLYGEFPSSKLHKLKRYITAYNGVLEDYMNDKVKYVITEKKWDKNFDDALNENEDLIFVKSSWIYKCHTSGKLVPYQPYIVIPDA